MPFYLVGLNLINKKLFYKVILEILNLGHNVKCGPASLSELTPLQVVYVVFLQGKTEHGAFIYSRRYK